MEKYELDKDISVLFVEAASFPDGIRAAFDSLSGSLSQKENRTFFGISHANQEGKIIYKAAAWEKYEGEGKDSGLKTLRIKKGIYTGKLIRDFRKNIPLIGETFRKLLAEPDLDKDSFCLEWYQGKEDVLCLVKLKSVQPGEELLHPN